MTETSDNRSFRRAWMAAGFATALAGDWLLAVRGASRTSPEFLLGVAAFAAAQALWSVGQRREGRPVWRVFAGAALPLGVFAVARLRAALPFATWAAVCAYSVLTAFSLSVAAATRRRFYCAGIALLAVSDLMIGGRLLGAPGCSSLSGPLYLASEACLVLSFLLGRREPRLGERRGPRTPSSLDSGMKFGAAAFAAFALAALSWPGGGYNPFMRMLSALGRTSVRGVDWPWCHWFFMAGMAFAALAAAAVFAGESRRLSGWRGRAAGWGLAANVGGLLAIGLVPENVDQFFHNVGCWGATLGGGAILIARDRPGRDRVWTFVLGAVAVAFGCAVALHAVRATPYAPWVPTFQKCVIVAFALWAVDCARRVPGARVRRGTWFVIGALVALVMARALPALRFVRPGRTALPEVAEASATEPESQAPFSDDERAALRFLDYVTGPLPPDDEREWWDVGGSQHGLFARRYHIAFCGYAAAALGARGGAGERAVAGRVLGRCVERMLRRDVWAYSMSRSYWGRKPWAPDPCYRENVMFTGHLLQLLALYEAFTGDARYWTEGWDFVWRDGRRVHYDVGALIRVTTDQMRHGPNGGVTCEPGLMFFPCNNHPHVALAIFSALGRGDWTADAMRWEKWALRHYAGPPLGGGALSLVYHARSGLFYPRGHNGLDGWSLLWFEPWVSDRSAALSLWREAAGRIDWDALENGADDVGEFDMCRNPADVPPAATAAFLAAAARACDDPATAARLEAIVDRSLVRRDGMLWLDLRREWRVGATAVRIVSLAESNGFRWRPFIRGLRRVRSGGDGNN